MTTTRCASLASFDTVYSADSIEFCPFQDKARFMACGTYELEKESRERKGRLYLFDVEKDAALNEPQQLDMPAILDMKWSHALHDGRPVLGVADALGSLHLYQLDDQLKKIESIKAVDQDNVLCLSLDWSGRRDQSQKIIASHSNGDLSLVIWDEAGLRVDQQWHAHDMEAWIAGFNYWDTRLVYSGADDCLFKGWDTRASTDTPLFRNKAHGMGVTTMQCSPHQEHLLATGSYDEHVYLWDLRNIQRPLQTIHTEGGGIWRLKWHPTQPSYLLSASMHAGAFVINTNSSSITHEFLDHTSMAYGADWSYDSKNTSVGSCSFYDHILHLWDPLLDSSPSLLPST